MSDLLTSGPARQGLIARIQAILLKPSPTWDDIALEPSTPQSILMGYVVPLAAIGPICGAIGMSLIGVGALGFSYHVPLLWAIITAVVGYVLSLVMVYVMAFIIDALAPNFDGQKNFTAAFKLAAYSGTAVYLVGIFRIIPMLGFIGILGLYSLYLFYVGLPKLMKNPPEKSIVYMVVIAVCGIVMSVIVGMVVGGVTMMGGGAALMGMHGLTPGVAGIGAPGGSITVNGANGATATVNLNQMAAAANQMAAQASAIQNGTTTTGAPVKTADPQALLALMPMSFNGAARADTSASSGGAAGISASNAEATYTIGSGSVHLKISDIGSMGGIGAMANAMNVNSSSSSADGYEILKTQGNQMITEKYNTTSKDGEYGIVLNGRINVDAEGSGVDIGTLKTLVAQIDINKADSLTH